MSGFNGIAQSYYFTHYQVEQGLSNNAVICSIMDSRGFMWFGTKDGLNRFDGYTFKTFRNDPNDKNTLGSNFISTLYEDDQGILWVGTENGLYRYDGESEHFIFINGIQQQAIESVIKQGSYLWIVSGQSLFRYNIADHSVASYRENFAATYVCKSYEGDIWVSTADGYLQRYNPGNNTFTPFKALSNLNNRSVSNWIENITSDGPGRLLIGASNQGVKIFNTITHKSADLVTRNENGTDIFARNFLRVSSDELWIATESGIFIYHDKTNKLVNLRKQYNNPYSLADNAVYTLFKDTEGGIWAGTYFGGVNYYQPRYTFFEKFFPRIGENSISGNAVREICRDYDGNLWIGTEDAGLNKFNLKTKQFSNYRPGDGRSGIANTNLHGLLINGNELWVGTFEHGLDVMDLHTAKVIRHYNAGPGQHQLKSNFIFCMLKTRAGDILVGTPVGLYKYNRQTDDFTLLPHLPASAFITAITQDSKGTLWTGTFRHGIFYLNADGSSGTLNHLLNVDMSKVRITDIFEDSENQMWFATESGLFKYNRQTKKAEQYTVNWGLPSNLIYSILEDARKQLWISTSKGLVSFDLATEKIRVFTKANGLLTDQFNYNSAYRDETGHMFFGSVKGMVCFNPDEFITNTVAPPIYITGFQVNNRELAVAQKGSPLKRSILVTRKIVLDYKSSSFSIDFSALSYNSPGTLEYAYRMDGLDNQWTYIKTNRKVYFTELPAGVYTFRVKAANSSGIWNNKEARLVIKILPPFWKSNTAYLIYTLLLMTAVIVLINRYNRKLQAKHRRQMEIFENEKEREIYEAKIEFFTNVAHEIRTPLTLIKGPMEKVMKKAGEVPDIEKNLRIIDRNTGRLLTLTNQLLDFRKTEAKGFSLNFVNVDIPELLTDIHSRFQLAAEHRNLAYKLLLPEAQLQAYVDAEGFTKIISNLLDNAIKYSDNHVEVELMPLAGSDENFTIEVRNDGKPMPTELSAKIFEPFFRINEQGPQPGTGIGLSISKSLAELHKGRLELVGYVNRFTIFALTLPVHQLIEFNLSGKWKKY
ncbi:ATP-binding protein [Mucilaginibacter roseus]|uniref:histidine kinase n=1 Tax=Mucilaginibacter roseus TaxID=1528868 RepID=A0ABS8U6I5_9SPHI|nr:sensor histidine kinase [Mucilaginibacter roseus]MCD8742252.1 ATP-binding protein [Mucilaginibacter roseus]